MPPTLSPRQALLSLFLKPRGRSGQARSPARQTARRPLVTARASEAPAPRPVKCSKLETRGLGLTDMMTRSLGRLAYAARASRAIANQPYEGVQRTFERVAEWRDRRRPSWPYEVTEAYEERLHELIGTQWPCEERHSFEEVWSAALGDVAARGLQVGRGAFGGWDDADARLGQVAWCLARHLRPKRIVETGVARGLTTRVLLEALERNGCGRLWSIDLPPLLERGLAQEIGAAVPERLHERWTLLRGSSRKLLPGLVAGLSHIDVFVHDSMHTARNLRFELEQVWPALAPGGAMLVDDVERNVATGQFRQARPETLAVISTSDDGEVLIGCLFKPSR
jgi:predicted O-methyltransferase YrrM